jgi:predicted NBD/HSP70 family sugar kinase
MRVLVVDIGGSHIKAALADSHERARIDSSDGMGPHEMMQRLMPAIAGWRFDVVSVGYPGHVGAAGPGKDPGNLGNGWVDFDYCTAFGKPVRIANDAVMQALGAHPGGRMLSRGRSSPVARRHQADRRDRCAVLARRALNDPGG